MHLRGGHVGRRRRSFISYFVSFTLVERQTTHSFKCDGGILLLTTQLCLGLSITASYTTFWRTLMSPHKCLGETVHGNMKVFARPHGALRHVPDMTISSTTSATEHSVHERIPRHLRPQEGGADVIELGVPFSDPQADGPTIQATNEVKLQKHIKSKRVVWAEQLRITFETYRALRRHEHEICC